MLFCLLERLIIGTESDLVWLDLVLTHIIPKLLYLIFELAGTAGLEKSAVDNFGISHFLKFLPTDVPKKTSTERDQFF